MNKRQIELEMAVMELHNIARLVEDSIGSGKLSEDIRKGADRLHNLISVEIDDGNQKTSN